MSTPNLVGISGSLRAGSFNTMLLNAAIASFGDADVTIGDLNLPLYSGDLETPESRPAPVEVLAGQIAAADAIIIASPEYNKGIPGVLKNALDWVSRVPGKVFNGKPVLLINAAAGRTGGETAHYHVRHCLAPLGAHVLPVPAVLIASAYSEFNEDGSLKSERYQASLDSAVAALRAAVS